MTWNYTETLKDHFFNPRNILEIPEEEFRPDGVGEVGNVKCGDMMKIFIKVAPDETIKECKWKTYGCASAIGSTSMLSTMVINKKLDEAVRITPKNIADALGGIPDAKFHCSVLGDKALKAAIENYFNKKGTPERITWKVRQIVCSCLDVDREEIEKLYKEGSTTFEQIQKKTKLGTSCGTCIEKTKNLLSELAGTSCPTS